MFVDVYAAYGHMNNKDMRNSQAVVIDTLRATTVMITALSNGCRHIVPALDVEEAIQIKNNMEDRSEALLGGERGSLKIPGFDLSNSPLEYERAVVYDKVLVFTTTNGTNAIHKVQAARRVLIGALINASAVARELASDGGDVTIVCSGTRGKYSLDDVLTAGCIITRLKQLNDNVQVDDLGFSAELLYAQFKDSAMDMLKHAAHYSILMDNGWEQDVVFAMQEDASDLVPVFKDGLIVRP